MECWYRSWVGNLETEPDRSLARVFSLDVLREYAEDKVVF